MTAQPVILKGGPLLDLRSRLVRVVAVLTALGAGTGLAAHPQELGGAITGVVVHDDAGARPISSVLVSLDSAAAARRQPVQVETDTAGRFVFSPVAAGTYVLRARKSGFEQVAMAPGESAGVEVVVQAGKWTTTQVVLEQMASVGGRVVDQAGQPIVGAPVRVVGLDLVAGLSHLLAGPISETDDKGEYTVTRLRPGAYYVLVPSVISTVLQSNRPAQLARASTGDSAVDTGAATISNRFRLALGSYPIPAPKAPGDDVVYPLQFYPNAITPGPATAITLNSGDERRGIDFILTPTKGVAVCGRLEGPANELSESVVRLVPRGAEDLGMGSEQATSVTAPDGTFCFLRVPPGAYTIIGRRSISEFVRGAPIAMGLPQTPGWTRGVSTSTAVASAPEGTRLAFRTSGVSDDRDYSQFVEVAGADVTGLSLAIRPLAVLSGRVVYEDGQPSQLAPVFVPDPADGSPALAASSARSSGNTSTDFSLAGLRAGDYFLRLRLNVQWAIRRIEVAGRDVSKLPIDMSNGDVRNVTVILTTKVTKLTGTVRDRDGKKIDAAGVIAFPADSSRWTRFGFDPPYIRSVVLKSGEDYQISGLPEGDYFVVAVGPYSARLWRDPQFLASASVQADRVSVRWGESVRQDLQVRNVRK